MKVAVLSESTADEAAIAVLVEGLLQRPIEVFVSPRLRTRGGGWTAVVRLLPTVLKDLHYQSDAEALVAVLDSDWSRPHRAGGDCPTEAVRECRLCKLRRAVGRIEPTLRPMEGKPPIRIALGLAVPQIEAWYLAGRDPHVSEAAWLSGLQSGRPPYTTSWLKQEVYDTDQPILQWETQRAREEAERIVRDGKLPLLEQLFPGGFGALAADVRGWRTGQ